MKVNSISVLTVLVLLCVSHSQLPPLPPPTPQPTFLQWMLDFGVTYSSPLEQAYRQLVYQANVASINSHNSNLTRTYNENANQFTDLTQD
jgi:hypothetical protein